MRIIACLLFSLQVYGAEIVADSCSRDHVNTAIAAASDGDIVMIPNGSCTWTSGITTTKQIWIRAQNYTPTSGGTMTRSVTLTNSSSAPLFYVTSGNDYHVRISGIRFNTGSTSVNHIRMAGTGSKVILIDDCSFEVSDRFGTAEDVAVIRWHSQGGVMWNYYFKGDGATGVSGASIHVYSPRSWTTASTMGTLDTDGNVNGYLENGTMMNIGQSPDVDNGGRMVIRYSTIDGSSGVTHGFTSATGGRHVEYYNNTFSVTEGERNHNGRYYWIRAGTGVFTDNVVNNSSNPGAYGNVVQLSIGDNTSPGSYPMDRQPGFGHNGTNHVSDPIYIWNQTGTRAYTYGFDNGWDSIVVVDRDIFVNNGAKPDYAKYTYPHPAREAWDNPTPPAGPPIRPAGRVTTSGNVRVQ